MSKKSRETSSKYTAHENVVPAITAPAKAVSLSAIGFKPVILYEDNHLLLVVKPAGLLSQADDSGKPDLLTLLKQDIKLRYNKPGEVFLGLVHRLDQPVAGVMVFARTSKAAARLSGQIRSHQLEKYYLAVVHGQVQPEYGRLQDHLQKNENTRLVQVCQPDRGQLAILDYQVLEYDSASRMSLVAIQLQTGRSHQIRVQFASRGWPLAGDHRYGLAARVDRSSIGSKSSEEGQPDIALFSCLLRLQHPTRPEVITGQQLPVWQGVWRHFQPPDLSLLPGCFKNRIPADP